MNFNAFNYNWICAVHNKIRTTSIFRKKLCIYESLQYLTALHPTSKNSYALSPTKRLINSTPTPNLARSSSGAIRGKTLWFMTIMGHRTGDLTFPVSLLPLEPNDPRCVGRDTSQRWHKGSAVIVGVATATEHVSQTSHRHWARAEWAECLGARVLMGLVDCNWQKA